MRKTTLLVLVCFILFLLYFLNLNATGFSTAKEEASVDGEIFSELDGKGKASVIVVLKEPKKTSYVTGFITAIVQTKASQQKVLSTLSKNEFKKKHEYSIIKGFSGEVTSEGLKKLKQNPNVEKIYFDKVYSISLTDSVPLINASKVHPYQINNQNITGYGETICILDTGIDTDHSSLSDKIVGCETFIDGTATCEDDHGHGTHVAGIAAANGNVIGVAPDASITMIKVCDSAGNCASSSILSGLEWCVTNKDTYNISVISMSFGNNGEHSSATCPSDSIDEGLASAFNAGIFLTAASGNNHYTSGISHPACNENVTSAGAVDKSDGITYNRGGDLLTLLAPSVEINSTYKNGGTAVMSGTSMSAPHVAGAAAILQQYARANAGLLTKSEIEAALNDTGKPIYDGASGGTYSRISVYEAVKSLTDVLGPSLNLIAPSNSTYNTNTSLSLSYIVSDLNNVDTVWYNINGGENIILSGDTTFDTIEDSQVLNFYSNDSFGNENSVSVSFTTDLTNPVITLTTQNNSYASNPITLAFSLTEQNPDSCNLYGSWDSWHLNQTKPASENNFTLNLEDGTYTWNVECNDTANNIGFGGENYTINIDSTLPTVIIDLPQNTTYATNTNVELNFSAVDSNLDSCWYSIDSGNDIIINNCENITFNASENSHDIKLFVNDSAGNENYGEVFFTTDLTNPVVNLESPLNSSFSSSKNIQFQFKAVDTNLGSCNLYGSWNSWHLNQTKSDVTSDSTASFDEIILEDGTYTWNVECVDSASRSDFNDTNHTLTIDTTSPSLIVSSPENITYSGNESLALSFSAVDNNLDSCWYSLNDGSNTTITNCENTTFNTPNEQNNLKIYVKDKVNNEISAEVSFVADMFYPLISLSSPSEGASIESPANFTYIVEDEGISNCNLLINGTVNSTDDSIITSVTQEFSVTLTDDEYYWSVKCVDNVNKENVSVEQDVTVCTENWNCTEWDSCSDSSQTRTCTDMNSCGTIYSKPAETRSCSSSDSGTSGEDASTGGSESISSDDEESEDESVNPPSVDLPDTGAPPKEEKQEEQIEIEELTKEIIDEEKGIISRAWSMLKGIGEWITHPKQTATSISTFAVDGVKNNRTAVVSFVFVIAVMLFAHFYFFKKYKINLSRKIKEKVKIPRPSIVIPQKIKDVKAKFKGVHVNIKENINPSVKIAMQPVKTAHKSILKKINLFKNYKALLDPKKLKNKKI